MDLITIRKKLSTFTSEKGYLKNVSDDVLYEVLIAWEQWTDPAKDFYKNLGFSSRQMATLIGKAKKLKRKGHFIEETFKEIKLDSSSISSINKPPCDIIELAWSEGRIIRFAQVEQLVEFLKKVA